MGSDIYIQAERKIDGKWQLVDVIPFEWRSYNMFAFLAGVNNYSAVKPIAEPRGLPGDEVDMEFGARAGEHSYSWLSLEELVSFDYDALMEDRRQCGATVEPGQGKMRTYREFLGEWFFADLEKLNAAGAERIVFSFDI